MMGTEHKTLLCFCHWVCHWGRKKKVRPDGSLHMLEFIMWNWSSSCCKFISNIPDLVQHTGYAVSHACFEVDVLMIAEHTQIKERRYVQFQHNQSCPNMFDRLSIDPSDKILHFTVKFDRSELMRLRVQEDVNVLLQLNDDSAHVYASRLENEPYPRPPSDDVKNIECVVDSASETGRICDCDRPETYDYPVTGVENKFLLLLTRSGLTMMNLIVCQDIMPHQEGSLSWI